MTRIEQLVETAMKALNESANNEITLTDGDCSIHLVRSTPVPYYSVPYVWPTTGNPTWTITTT